MINIKNVEYDNDFYNITITNMYFCRQAPVKKSQIREISKYYTITV